jgi:solute carrier family 39 (zinc transporter), member 1/2/3
MTPSCAALLLLLLLADAARADECGGDGTAAEGGDHARARPLKLAAFFSILACGALGCLLPVLGRRAPALRPDGDVFFLLKAFAAGVILATGFIHILPDAFDKLSSPCLGAPWKDFPFAGFGAMVGAIGTLVVDTLATGYFTRVHFNDSHDVEKQDAPAKDGGGDHHHHEGQVHVHTHATHGHAHGPTALVAAVGGGGEDDTMRHRVISQVRT